MGNLESLRVDDLGVVQLISYDLRAGGILERLEAWDEQMREDHEDEVFPIREDGAVTLLVRIDALHDAAFVLRHFNVQGELTPGEVATWCKYCQEWRPGPEGALGETLVVLAGVESPRREELAKFVFAHLANLDAGDDEEPADPPSAPAEGGDLDYRTGLWIRPDDARWLAMLSNPRADVDAAVAKHLYLHLRLADFALHKFDHERRQSAKLARQARELIETLADRHGQLDRLVDSLGDINNISEGAFQEFLNDSLQSTEEFCRFVEEVRTTQARQRNCETELQVMISQLANLGGGQGATALIARRQQDATHFISQMREDMATCVATLERARLTREQHRASLLTAVSVFDISQKKLREAEKEQREKEREKERMRQDRFAQLVAAGGLSLGLVQIWGIAIDNYAAGGFWSELSLSSRVGGMVVGFLVLFVLLLGALRVSWDGLKGLFGKLFRSGK